MTEIAPLLVLVIDDDAAIRLSLSILLRAKGYRTIVADCGAAGFEQFVENRPHIVISDMVMPGHEGIATIRKIRDMDAEVIIIAMSGSIEGGPMSFLQKARDAGADASLEKPFETAQLLQVIKAASRRSDR